MSGMRTWIAGLLVRIPRYGDGLVLAVNRQVGFSGNGPTPLDRPARELTRLEEWLTRPLRGELAAVKRKAWRESVIAVTGEDPEEDWHG